jgi:serpin B
MFNQSRNPVTGGCAGPIGGLPIHHFDAIGRPEFAHAEGISKENKMYRARRGAFIAGCIAAAGLVLLLPGGVAAQDTGRARLLTEAYNASGEGLFRQFPPGNVVFSPYSIGTAMAMALAGAREETEREMIAALKQRLSRPEIDAANTAVLSTLNGYDKSAVPPTCPAGMRLNDRRCESGPGANGCQFQAQREGGLCVATPTYPPSAKLSVADALMLTRHGDLIAESYEALLRDKYAAEVFRNATLADINGWVSRKTEGKIDKILDRLDPDSAAVLLNAVYFKARWASVFSKDGTKDEPFNLISSEKVPVAMMNKVVSCAVVARPGYRAVRLPYDVGALGMIIVLPDAIDGDMRLDADELPRLLAALRSPAEIREEVTLALPRFKVNFEAELVKLFQQAGMVRAFDAEQADFSGMTGRPQSEAPFFIGGILHRAVIEVMEGGTEAAAVTAIGFRFTGGTRWGGGPPEVFRVDRPFLFYIVDDATGAILFQGRVVDPR